MPRKVDVEDLSQKAQIETKREGRRGPKRAEGRGKGCGCLRTRLRQISDELLPRRKASSGFQRFAGRQGCSANPSSARSSDELRGLKAGHPLRLGQPKRSQEASELFISRRRKNAVSLCVPLCPFVSLCVPLCPSPCTRGLRTRALQRRSRACAALRGGPERGARTEFELGLAIPGRGPPSNRRQGTPYPIACGNPRNAPENGRMSKTTSTDHCC